MKLLVITQKVDVRDDNLGFFHHWLEKFAEKADKVYVICLWQGEYSLPSNVVVRSMGKEKGVKKLGQFLRLQKYLIQTLPQVDGVFVHMCPIYALASFLLVKFFRKKIILWYAHVKPGFLTKPTLKMVYRIFTPSKESFNKKSGKVVVTGHGIDTDLFKPAGIKPVSGGERVILSTGRFAPVKDLETLLSAFDILVNQKGIKDVKAKLIGSVVEDYEKEYLAKLKSLVEEKKLKDYVEFLPGVANREVVNLYQTSDVFVNLTAGGGAGKAALEAMACGTPVVLCTSTFNEFLGDFQKETIFKEKDPQDLAQKLLNCLSFSEEKRNAYAALSRNIVVQNHNLDNLIDKIINGFSK